MGQIIVVKVIKPNLLKGFNFVMGSLEDESATNKILLSAATQFPRILSKNLNKSTGQSNKLYKSGKQKSGSGRKNSALRKFHPTDAVLFQYLIKQFTRIEELKRESEGETISDSQAFVRFFHESFQDSYLLRGASHAITGIFGGLYDMNCHVQSDISNFLHGLRPSEYEDTIHHNFKDADHFKMISIEASTALLKREAFRRRFELVSLESLDYHQPLKHNIEKYTSEWYAFEEADDADTENAHQLFEWFAPWGIEPIDPNLIHYNLRYNPIPGLRDMNPRKLEQTVISAIFSPEIVSNLVKNEGVKTTNMKNRMLLPVLGNGKSLGKVEFKKYDQVNPLLENEIAWELLKNPIMLKTMREFTLVVQIDGRTVRRGNLGDKIFDDLVIPSATKIISLFAEKELNEEIIEMIPIATVLPDLTDLAEGLAFASKIEMENGYVFNLEITPEASEDAAENIYRMNLKWINHEKFSAADEKSQRSNFFAKTGGFVSSQIESFVQTLCFLGFDAQTALRNTALLLAAKSSFVVFTLAMVVSGGLLYLVTAKGIYENSFSILIPIIASFIISSCLLTTTFFSKSAENRTLKIFSSSGFFAGVATISVLVSVFVYLTISPTLPNSVTEMTSAHLPLTAQPAQTDSAHYTTFTLGNSENSPPMEFTIGKAVAVGVDSDSDLFQTKNLKVNNLNRGTRLDLHKVSVIKHTKRAGVNKQRPPEDSVQSFSAVVRASENASADGTDKMITIQVDSLVLKDGYVFNVNFPEQKIPIDASDEQIRISMSVDKTTLVDSTGQPSAENASADLSVKPPILPMDQNLIFVGSNLSEIEEK